jgi:Uma2 family endonuclease
MARAAPITDTLVFTVDDLDRMYDIGILDPDDRVELLDGQIIMKPRESPEHQLSVGRVHRALSEVFPWAGDYWIRLGAPSTVDEFSLPEPDLAVISGGMERFGKRHPRGAEIILTVEVSLATVARDRGQKAAIYARAACPVYWVIDMPRRELVVHTGPREDGTWASVRTYRPGELVEVPQAEVAFGVADLLPDPVVD